MIKDIVVNLPVDSSRDVVTAFSASVAATLEAHLSGVALIYDPLVPMMADMYGVPPDLIETQRVQNRKAAKAAVQGFEDVAERAAIRAETRMVDAPAASAPSVFARVARRFDLSVIGQPEPHKPTLDTLIVEAALFDSGRPVLIVPYIQRTALKLDRVLVCWDGSRSAARAAGDAMPFIVRAKATELVMVASEAAKSDELPADMAQHLARHGAKVSIERIVSTEVDVASTILSHAADTSADLLVMGGYGHSRLREFVLGGVTRSILAAMTVPTLMSH